MKRLTVAVLILGTFSSTGFTQSTEQVIRDRHRVFVGWLGMVRTAEFKYRSRHGAYGNLTALRDAHLLDAFVFETRPSPESPPDSTLIPTSTSFQVTVSSDGQHYHVAIRERLVDVGNIGLSAGEASTEWMVARQPHLSYEDGPEGPLPSLAR